MNSCLLVPLLTCKCSDSCMNVGKSKEEMEKRKNQPHENRGERLQLKFTLELPVSGLITLNMKYRHSNHKDDELNCHIYCTFSLWSSINNRNETRNKTFCSSRNSVVVLY